LEELKFLMKTEAGMTFNTNVLRIALNLSEEKIASIIVAGYMCKVDEEMVLRAVKTGQQAFL
jgi:DeoR/GlpR family transcriptional regulator of sugar metabolism